jgi:serine/threonine-protein kinase
MKKIGRYEVIEELGRGAMGVVYKASDPTIGRLVAVKVLTLDDKTDEGTLSPRDTFLREARAAGRLSHHGIVTIHDALEDESTRSSYIVMEYIPGKTLEKLLIANPRLETEKAFDIIRQVAEALDYAHRNQIIHRDLKPANIILTEDGRAKITDFGIAKIAAQNAMRTVAIMGTPSYMSPEQVTGGEIDARADIFSLGILLYLMLVGEKPFVGDTAAVMFKIVYEDPVAPSKVNPKLTAADDYVILRCLAKDRAMRYSSAREFLDDLDDLRSGRPPRSQAKVSPADLHAAERTVAASHPLIPLRPPAGETPTVPLAAAAVPPHPAPPAVTTPVPLAAAVPPASPPSGPPVDEPPAAPPPAAAATTTASLALKGKPPAAATDQRVTTAPAAVASERKSSNVVFVVIGLVILLVAGGGFWYMKNPRRAAPASPPPPNQLSETAAVTAPSPAPPEPKPENTAPAVPKTAAKAAARAEVASAAARAGTPPPASVPTPTTDITVYCKHEFEQATLLVLDGAKTLYQARLSGKKKKGFIGIGGKGFGGELQDVTALPVSARDLTVRVYTDDGAVNIQNSISAPPPEGGATMLRVTPSRDHLKLEWTKPRK